MSVAETILKQMSGMGKIKAMVGGKDFVTNGNDITFKFKMCKRTNCVKITLNGKDLYDIVFYKVKKFDYDIVELHYDVYCDQLKPIFEKTTGLYLSL